MRRYLIPTLAALAAAALTAGIASAGHSRHAGNDGFGSGRDHQHSSYAVGLWGDLPYSTLQATTGVPNLIADMNSQDLAFTAHDGDLKAGSTECLPAVYDAGGLVLQLAEGPRGVYARRQRLGRLRPDARLQRSGPAGQGARTVLLDAVHARPAPPAPGGSADAALPGREREYGVRREPSLDVGGVTYATLNIQGTCNNLCDSKAGGGDADPTEYAARNAADIAWMQGTFDEAKARHSAAVMLITQADPGFNDDQVQGAPTRNPMTLVEDDAQASTDGFGDFLRALRDQVIAFRRPVVYVHGDSHYFRVDRPLENSTGQRLENFTRLETFGDHQENGTNDVNWVKVLVDPNSREVFSFQPQIVPANRTAVPAP